MQRRITKNGGGIAGEKRRVDAEKARVAGVGGSHAGQSGAPQQVGSCSCLSRHANYIENKYNLTTESIECSYRLHSIP